MTDQSSGPPLTTFPFHSPLEKHCCLYKIEIGRHFSKYAPIASSIPYLQQMVGGGKGLAHDFGATGKLETARSLIDGSVA